MEKKIGEWSEEEENDGQKKEERRQGKGEGVKSVQQERRGADYASW